MYPTPLGVSLLRFFTTSQQKFTRRVVDKTSLTPSARDRESYWTMEDERALRRELDTLARKREQLDASRTLRWKDECLFARTGG